MPCCLYQPELRAGPGLGEVVCTQVLPQPSLLPFPQFCPLLAMVLEPGEPEAEALGGES